MRNAAGMSNTDDRKTESTTVQAENRVVANFMEIDGRVSENVGENGGIRLANRTLNGLENSTINQEQDTGRENEFENDTVILENKRKRVKSGKQILVDGLDTTTDSTNLVGPKNVQKAGPVNQARLQQ